PSTPYWNFKNWSQKIMAAAVTNSCSSIISRFSPFTQKTTHLPSPLQSQSILVFSWEKQKTEDSNYQMQNRMKY
ncbi:10021_t:CDS:2, partial [Diversispora eburnea]